MTRLNQIVAVQQGVASRAERALTDAYHSVQKAPMLAGIDRTYQPREDDGEMFPPEKQHVQTVVDDVCMSLIEPLGKKWGVMHVRESANIDASADLVVDGETIARDVPVTFLLPFEKELANVITFISKLPTLDTADEWTWDEDRNAFAAEPVHTVKTKKVPRNHVKAPATDKHPAQVEIYFEDIVAGDWTTVKLSGAISASTKREMLARATALLDAVKKAREAANELEVDDGAEALGSVLSRYIFAGE